MKHNAYENRLEVMIFNYDLTNSFRIGWSCIIWSLSTVQIY